MQDQIKSRDGSKDESTDGSNANAAPARAAGGALRVEFWFDVGSPYSYLAYKALPQIARAAGAEIDWRPMLLGGVFKATGNHSPAEIAAKGRWLDEDLARWARHGGVRFRRNPYFPINTLMLMRGAAGYRLQGDAALQRYLAAIFDAMWADAKNMGDPAEVAAVLGAAGFDAQEFMALVGDPGTKEALKRDTEEAIARGVFGAPTFFVGQQMFWGRDRLHFVAEALAQVAGGQHGERR